MTTKADFEEALRERINIYMRKQSRCVPGERERESLSVFSFSERKRGLWTV